MNLSDYHDNSQLDKFFTCPRLYSHIYQDGLIEPMGPSARCSVHLYHYPIGLWYKTNGKFIPEPENWQLWYERCKFTPAELLKDKKHLYSVANAKHAFEVYTKQFASDLEEYDILGVEQNYVDTSLGFLSRPDVVVRSRDTGDKGTIELKVTSWAAITRGAEFNTQLLGQIHTTGAKFALLTVMSFGDDPSPTRLPPVRPDDYMLADWKRNIAIKIETVNFCKVAGWPKVAPGACTSFNKPCFLIDVCATEDPARKQALIDEMEHGDPYEYLKEEEE